MSGEDASPFASSPIWDFIHVADHLERKYGINVETLKNDNKSELLKLEASLSRDDSFFQTLSEKDKVDELYTGTEQKCTIFQAEIEYVKFPGKSDDPKIPKQEQTTKRPSSSLLDLMRNRPKKSRVRAESEPSQGCCKEYVPDLNAATLDHQQRELPPEKSLIITLLQLLLGRSNRSMQKQEIETDPALSFQDDKSKQRFVDECIAAQQSNSLPATVVEHPKRAVSCEKVKENMIKYALDMGYIVVGDLALIPSDQSTNEFSQSLVAVDF